MSRRVLTTILFAFILCIVLAPLTASASKMCDFRADMRKLWEDHVSWTRLYIVSAVADLPDKTATADRLLQNQTDIGNAVKMFYGEAAGTKLTGLLKEHIMLAGQLVEAAKAGETAKKDEVAKKWYANADEIAMLLSGANPKHWPEADMKKMLREHLDLTAAEAVARLEKNWAVDIATYDKVHMQILVMADALSSGIEAQFPEKFTEKPAEKPTEKAK